MARTVVSGSLTLRSRGSLRPLVAAALLALVGSSGCCSYTQAANRVIVNQKARVKTDETPNCGLNDRAPIIEAGAAFQDQTLQANATVESQTDKQQDLEYLFEWYDADGFQFKESTTLWQTLILDARAKKQLLGTSPKPGAEKVVFSLRPIKSIAKGR